MFVGRSWACSSTGPHLSLKKFGRRLKKSVNPTKPYALYPESLTPIVPKLLQNLGRSSHLLWLGAGSVHQSFGASWALQLYKDSPLYIPAIDGFQKRAPLADPSASVPSGSEFRNSTAICRRDALSSFRGAATVSGLKNEGLPYGKSPALEHATNQQTKKLISAGVSSNDRA